jgi:hypothetical protein
MSNAGQEDDLVNVYVAGIFDAEQAVRCTIAKESTNRVGYRIVPKVELRSKSQELIHVVLNWLNEMGIHTNIEKRGSKAPDYMISVSKRDDVKRILETISPYLIVQDRDAEIVLEEIIPRLDDNSVLTEERFIEVVGYVEQLTETRNRNRQYDLEFFREEFGVDEAEPTD